MPAFSLRLVFALGFLAPAVFADSKDPPKHSHSPKIALVLEGGGALGFAHVGVLKVLEEEHIPIDFIAGTSMGSIVGAAYASGRTVPELAEVLSTTNWDELFNESVPRQEVTYRQKAGRDGEIFGDTKLGIKNGGLITATALVEGQSIEPLFQELFRKVPASCSFDDLPIRYRAVAADIETGEAIVLDSGSLAMAARSSMSVPGFFSPVELNGKLLVDGGVTNNFPVDVARNAGAEVIIGVEFGFEPWKREKLTGPLAISAQILNLLLERTSVQGRALMRPQDIMIHPDVTGYTSTSFTNAKEIMQAGEDAARKLIPTLRRLAVSKSAFAAYQHKRTSGPDYAPTIDYVRIEGVPNYQAAAIRETLELRLGQKIDYSEIEKQITEVHQTGDYKKVSYDIEEKDGKHGLVLRASEKDWVKQYLRLGFSLEDDFEGSSNYSMAAQLRLRGLNEYGAYLDTSVEIGRSPKLSTEFYQPLWAGSPLFVAPDFTIQRQDLYIRDEGDVVAQYQRDSTVFGLKGGISFEEYGEWNFGWRRGPARLRRHIGEPTLPSFDYDIGEFVSRFVLDQYDNPDFPTKGYRLNLIGTASRESAGSDSDFEQGRINAGLPITIGNTTLVLNGEMGVSSDDLSPERSYSLGGFFDVSGFAQGSLLADNYWVGRSLLFYRFEEGGSSIFKFGGYVGGSFEYATLRSEIQQIGDDTGIVAGSVFVGADTPLLPIYLGYGFNNDSEQSFYLAIGRLAARRR